MTMTAPERTVAAVPRATRSRRPGWRNPRLLLGIVLVAGSVVLGARLLAAADDTVAVWAVAADLPTGASARRGETSSGATSGSRMARPPTATSLPTRISRPTRP